VGFDDLSHTSVRPRQSAVEVEDSRLTLSSRPKGRDPENISAAMPAQGILPKHCSRAAHRRSSASICGTVATPGPNRETAAGGNRNMGWSGGHHHRETVV